MIFSGNLRLNLDPFESHTDEELWKILELSHLKNFVSGLEEGLLYPISEEGGNLRYVKPRTSTLRVFCLIVIVFVFFFFSCFEIPL